MWLAFILPRFQDGWVLLGAMLYGTSVLGWGGCVLGVLINLIWSAAKRESLGHTFTSSAVWAFVIGHANVFITFIIVQVLPNWGGC